MKKYTILLIFALASIAAPAQCPVTNTAFKSGETSKQKRIFLRGISAAQVEERLKAALAGK